MRLVIAIIVIIYLVGVGVELAPIFQVGWNHSTASELSSAVIQALPDACAWPMHVYRRLTETPVATPAASSS